MPTSFPNSYVVNVKPSAGNLLNFDLGEFTRSDFADFFCEAKLVPGSDTIAMLYLRYQFGYFVSQAGNDGRLRLLCEADGHGPGKFHEMPVLI